MDKLKVGVIGAGWQGQNHAQAYSELGEAELIAIADINREKGLENLYIYHFDRCELMMLFNLKNPQDKF